MNESQFWQFLVTYWFDITVLILCVILLVLLMAFVTLLLNRRYLKHRNMVWLELTPPASITRTPEATEQLFSVIHGMYSSRRLKDRLLGRAPVFSFEITSTKQDGIRYLVQVEKSLSQSLQKTISAYVSDAKVKQVDISEQTVDDVIEFKEMAHYIFPLTLTSAFDQHDPLAYVTNAMTKLDESEQVTMQLMLTPVKLPDANKLAKRILGNEDMLSSTKNGHIIWLQRISNLLNSVLWSIVDTTSEVYHGTTSNNYTAPVNDKDAQFNAQVSKRQRPARTLSTFELELMESMHQKVTQPLFQVSLRILVSGNNPKEHIASLRIDDVIYMNPDDLAHPVGMNLLEIPDGLEGDDLLREKDFVTESTISVMRKIFSEDDSGGHRIEYILRNAIQTALTLEGSTLFTIFQLLNDSRFRRDVVRKLDDENLRNFWKNEIGRAGEMQRVKMSAGITAKIGRFLFSASARRVLEQEKSTIDFDQIINDGKILICNFSKGLLGEDTSALFGTTVLAKLQLASLRRARMSVSDRRPFYLYVDEFQNFATTGFTQMLSEARKYRLFLTMAEQSTSQQDQQKLVDVILANVGTVVCFRSGSPADERLVLPLFSPYVEEGEIANLPTYSFYARIAAIRSQEPMSGVTLLLEDDGDAEIAKRVVKESRKKYTKTIEEQKQKEID